MEAFRGSKTSVGEEGILTILHDFLEASIRGISGITRSQVEKIKRHIINTVSTKIYGTSLRPSIDSSMMIPHLQAKPTNFSLYNQLDLDI